jgi:hypothetical protein
LLLQRLVVMLLRIVSSAAEVPEEKAYQQRDEDCENGDGDCGAFADT